MRPRLLSSLQLIGLAIVAVALPFELTTPIVNLGPIVITNLEAILYVLVMLWLIQVWRARRMQWSLVHNAVLAWLVVQFLAAILAPVEREAAIKFALRSTGGALLFFIAADAVRFSRRAAWIMSAVAIGAVVSAAAGWFEVESSTAQAALLMFKTQTTLIGGEVRAGGTFQYANTAAMYWEAALPIVIAVGVWWSAGHARQRWLLRGVALVGSVILIEAVMLSASRAALVSMGLSLGIMIIADRASSIQSGVGRPAAIGLIVLLVLFGMALFINPLFTARLRSESDDSWFRADIQPVSANLSASSGQILTQSVVVTNTSVRTWPAAGAQAVHLSYHWIQPQSRRVLILDGARTLLPHDLAPGEATTIDALFQVPALTGTLQLQWDLVQEDVAWFSTRGGPAANVDVKITSAQPRVQSTQQSGLQTLRSTSSPPRADLWRAGLKMWSSYPLLGIGPDNFRHVYGSYLGRAEFDDRITANNWYVEVLATVGLVGLIAGFFIVATIVIVMRRQWPLMTAPQERALTIGLSVALLTFLMHGTFDYFMEFTPTYGLLWLIAGLLVGLLTGMRDAGFTSTANRV
jgi:hypothetical protein